MIPETRSGARASGPAPEANAEKPEESEPMKRPARTELLVMAAMAAVAILLV
jgi:hypothetical protein